MVIGVLPGHKGRIGHHDHTHFIGQNPWSRRPAQVVPSGAASSACTCSSPARPEADAPERGAGDPVLKRPAETAASYAVDGSRANRPA